MEECAPAKYPSRSSGLAELGKRQNMAKLTTEQGLVFVESTLTIDINQVMTHSDDLLASPGLRQPLVV